MTDKLIKPATLKGFRDYLPEAMMARERLISTARRTYRSFGFSPIDTPALEYTEILLGKGGGETDKQMFRFTDQGGRDVAMRFDLTVPFARFAAQHIGELGTPFKRYHIGTVWRAEKPQKGRYREFMQCDFDTIGTDSNAADIEALFVIHDLFEQIGNEFKIPEFDFQIRVNNRMVLNGLLQSIGRQEQSAGILRVLDKLPKVGPEKVKGELQDALGLTETETGKILDATHHISSEDNPPEEILKRLPTIVGNSSVAREGISRLRELFAVCQKAALPPWRVILDVSIARGLDYYTGTIYETFLTAKPEIGSVCSGGRYDNLAGLYTSREMPGVGASLGLDRLLSALEELDPSPKSPATVPVFMTVLDSEALADYFHAAQELRKAKIGVSVFPDAPKQGTQNIAKQLKKQLKRASKGGFRLAVIAGPDELASSNWQVKDLTSGEQRSIPKADLADAVKQMLSNC